MKDKLLIWKTVMVTLTFASAGTALSGLVGGKSAGAVLLIVGSLNAGTAFYDAQTRTPNSQIVSYARGDGTIRAGEASVSPTDSPVAIGQDPLDGRSVALMPLVSPVQPDTPAIT